MTYFRELPNIEYQNFLASSSGSQDYILMKNLFIRGKLRDDLQNVFTIFNRYTIYGDERPDQIANKLYGDPGLDWVVLINANIYNFQNDYPLSSQQLWVYVTKKYGEENINNVNYYETRAVRDSRNRLILPGKQTVDKNFTIPNPDIPGGELNPVTAVTNFEMEGRRNDEKRQIFVLKNEYIGQFIKDMRDISTYSFNSEFVDKKTIRVTNTKNQRP